MGPDGTASKDLRVTRLGVLLGKRAIPFLLVGGSACSLALALANLARIAAALLAVLPFMAGLIQLSLVRQRRRRGTLRKMRRELRAERAVGRLWILSGFLIAGLAAAAPPVWAVSAAFLVALTILIRGFVIAADSAIKEEKLPVDGASAADECSLVQRWARRAATSESWLAKKFNSLATSPVPAGKIGRIQHVALSLVGTAVLGLAVIGAALGAEALILDGKEPAEELKEEEDELFAGSTSPGRSFAPMPPVDESTYEDECPELPDPFAIGHGLGGLFYADGAFKAGCGTEAEQVLATGVWFARGICGDHLRSLAVVDRNGDRAMLYGAAAHFALHAARGGELVSAAAADPAGGDVFVVETMSGSHGFARQAGADGGSGEIGDCGDVAGTDRPFAELSPPMMLHWRNLLEQRSAWSWPVRDGAPEALAFTAHPSGAIVARGSCVNGAHCTLTVGEETWPHPGPSFVSLPELEPYMPPAAAQD